MKLLAIDGNSILNRAFYGIKALTTKNGEFTNGIYGFLSILLRLLDETKPDAVACAFDLRAPTFRHKLYDGYKAQRKGMPEELASQLAPLKELLTALGYVIVSKEGFEADDLLGTLARGCSDRGENCIIATGDRDSFQLIGERVQVRYASTKMGQATSTLYDVDAVQAQYGVTPRQLIEVKALMGDASDNIPGVAGVGEKTALALIAAHESLDRLYSELDSPDIKAGVRKKLEDDREMAYLSRTLAEINCDAPIETDPAHYRRGAINHPVAAALFARLEMFKLAERWGVDPAAAAAHPAAPAALATPAKPLALTCDPTDLSSLFAEEPLVDLLIRWESGLPAACAASCPGKLALFAGELLDGLLALPTKLRLWSSKPLYKYLYTQHKDIHSVIFDGELAAYLLSPTTTTYEVKSLAAQYGVAPAALEGAITFGYDDLASEGALLTTLLDTLSAEIDQGEMRPLLENIELPLARVLAGMECEGFALDCDALRIYGDELDGRIRTLEDEVYSLAKHPFNLNSPKQLGEVLFSELGLPSGKKTKTGFSTNAEILEKLRGQHPIIDQILDYRKLAKLKSTYVDGLLRVAGADGRVRSTFQQTETRTGRISSTEPNLQNIPIRTEEGSRMRRFFRPRTGWKLIDADYSQIELRVLADLADDKNMISAFQSGADIHTATAAQVFGLPQEMVTSQLRSRAKAVNFGIVYGIGAFSLSQDISVSVAEADTYIKSYLATYSGVAQYMAETIAFARANGYVKTSFGRRRYLPELSASNKVTQAFGERVARNTPIQGTAADIIKIAMIRVYERLDREKLKARLILQVHDELLVEAPLDEIDRATAILKEEMEQAIALKVPLVADAHVGDNWLDAK